MLPCLCAAGADALALLDITATVEGRTSMLEVVASDGAGVMNHFVEAAQADADILLAASVFHFNLIAIPALKAYLKGHGVNVVMC